MGRFEAHHHIVARIAQFDQTSVRVLDRRIREARRERDQFAVAIYVHQRQ
jgi:hypothetical protein